MLVNFVAVDVDTIGAAVVRNNEAIAGFFYAGMQRRNPGIIDDQIAVPEIASRSRFNVMSH